MLQRTVTSGVLVFAAVLTCARPAHAQQTLNFTIGYFAPFSEGGRVNGDVLNVNRTFLVFDVDEFGGASVGGEWLLPIGNFFEAGAGVSFSRQTVPSVYQDFVDSDGTEIDQDLQLRVIPVAFTFRVLPFGQSSPLQPYFGAGVGLVNWRYREEGEFVDFGAGRVIFEDVFEASGTSSGPVVLGGIRFAGRTASAGGEIRYQKADGDLPIDFAGSHIDLGGWTYNFTVGLRF
jgi:hypothetical protein